MQKIKISFEARKNCWVSFDGELIEKGETIHIQVPPVFQEFFNRLKKNPSEPLGYVQSID